MIAGGGGRAEAPTPDTVAELLRWRPAHGVLSLYVDVDPADRGGGWRIALCDELDREIEAAAGGENREARLAVEAMVRRIKALLDEPGEAEHSGLIGFVEVSRRPADERWFASQLPTRRTEAYYGRGRQVGLLLALLDDGAPMGVAAAFAERVRLFDWRLGQIEQLHDWELEVGSLDWRERKALRPSGRIARLGGCARAWVAPGPRLGRPALRLALRRRARRGLRGPSRRFIRPGSPAHPPDRRARGGPSSDAQPRARAGPDRARKGAGVRRGAQHAGGPGDPAGARTGTRRAPGLRLRARRRRGRADIELALSTGAAITPVEEESAPARADQDGVAALLRY